MSESEPGVEGEKLELLLELYQELREEVRAHGKRKSRRYLGALTALGVILGYLFTTNGDARVLVLVPFVLGFLYLSQISSMNYVVQLAALLSLIEAKIDYLGAEYEYYHGGFNVDVSHRFEGIDTAIETTTSEQGAIFSPVTERIQAWGLRRIAGDRSDPGVLQHAVQSRTRAGMHLLAVISYFGAAGIGAFKLATKGIPELGLTGNGALLVSSSLLAVQIGIFVQIVVAWSVYRHHQDVLAVGVEKQISDDDVDLSRGILSAD